MTLPKELTTVTPLSKTLALIMFTTMPIIGFFLGMRYQEIVDRANYQQVTSSENHQTASPTPTCRPRPGCLDTTPKCMIETADMCPRPTPTSISNRDTCPKTDYVNCMPIVSVNGKTPPNPQCSKEYLKWAQKNCPEFKGAVY